MTAATASSPPLDLTALTVGQRFNTVLAVANIEQRQGKKPWLYVELANETGRIETRIWSDKLPEWRGIAKGMAVRVQGEYEASKNARYGPSFTVTSPPEQVAEHAVTAVLSQAPVFPGDRADLERRFDKLVGTISDPAWRRFVQLYFAETCPRAAFFEAPAAKGMHHSFSAGLAQHTIEVTEMCVRTAHQPEYRHAVEKDFLTVGALVHDADKRNEYRVENGQYVMTRRGRQYNHIIGGPIEIKLTMERHRAELEALGLTDSHVDDLVGLVAQHHGQLAWGANLEPASVEAEILHQCDNASAKITNAIARLTTGVTADDGVVHPAPGNKGFAVLTPTVSPAVLAAERRAARDAAVAADREATPRLAPPIEPGPMRGAVKRVNDAPAPTPTTSARAVEARPRQGFVPG